MLKVEKDRQASLCFYARERLFTKTFIQAFGLALGFHLFGILLFHIKPIQLAESSWVFPPALVDADLQNEGNESTSAFARSEQEKLRGISFPKPSQPTFPQISVQNRSEKMEESIQMPSSSLFSQIERIEEPIELLPLYKHLRLQIKTSGLLADFEFQEDKVKLVTEKLKQLKLPGSFLLKYNVQLDNQTGRIFWIAADHDALDPLLESLGYELVKNLQFTPKQTGFATTGTIELSVSL